MPNSTTELIWGLTPQQARKFLAWCGVSVLLPLLVFAVMFLITLMNGQSSAFIAVLARGDLLLLGIALLGMAIPTTLEYTLESPNGLTRESVIVYALFLFNLLLFVATGMIYVYLATECLLGPHEEINIESKALLFTGTVLTNIMVCGSQYLYILRLKSHRDSEATL